MGTKLQAPAAERNKQPIWDVFSKSVLPRLLLQDKKKKEEPLQILEVAGGCGVHTSYFGSQLVSAKIPFVWYPTDPDPTSRASALCYIQDNDDLILDQNVQHPQSLTLNQQGVQEEEQEWSVQKKFDLMICINMIHISSWDSTIGLMKLAGEQLSKNGILYLYGPYKIGGTAVASNLQFDQNLRSRDPSWGVRNLEDVIALAEENGLEFVETIEMPANNLSVLFRRL